MGAASAQLNGEEQLASRRSLVSYSLRAFFYKKKNRWARGLRVARSVHASLLCEGLRSLQSLEESWQRSRPVFCEICERLATREFCLFSMGCTCRVEAQSTKLAKLAATKSTSFLGVSGVRDLVKTAVAPSAPGLAATGSEPAGMCLEFLFCVSRAIPIACVFFYNPGRQRGFFVCGLRLPAEVRTQDTGSAGVSVAPQVQHRDEARLERCGLHRGRSAEARRALSQRSGAARCIPSRRWAAPALVAI